VNYPQYQSQPTSGAAIASLVLGICGLVVCPLVCSVLAIVYGKNAQRDIAVSGNRLGGGSLATAGIITGWVGIGICVLAVLLIIFGIILAAGTATSV
jgi:Domain of unknown function (DUF4190)